MENKKNCQQKENVPCSKIRNTKCKLATQKSNEKKMKDKEKIAIIRDTNETCEATEQMEKLLWKN